MASWQWWLLVGIVLVLAAVFYHWLPQWRLNRALNRPFPEEWQHCLEGLPFYRRLGPSLQHELRQAIKSFLHSKRFVGCEGLVVSDEMRVTIAAEACLLILNRPSSGYRDLRWIYLYPTAFRSKMPETDRNGVVSRRDGSLLGVSWGNGRIVLAWDAVRRGVSDHRDGHNVVLHEFAHQLDQEGGAADGAPLLYNRDAYRVWSRVLGREFEHLREQLAAGQMPLIDEYGAVDPAEFFAVVTEMFYERPADLSRVYPELYATLAAYFRIDPRDWHPLRPQEGGRRA